MQTKKEYRKAVFIVTYKIENNAIYYLLLKRKLHWKGWEFPKGGIDKGENAKQAALRECFEESGFKSKKIISFNISGKYKYPKILKDRPNRIGQTYKLFACEVKPKPNQKVKFDKKEHSNFLWLDFEKAIKKLSWPDQKKCLKIVNNRLLKI